jgi:hypothetical protein
MLQRVSELRRPLDVDAQSAAVGGEGASGLAGEVVMPNASGQSERSDGDAGSESGEAAGAVTPATLPVRPHRGRVAAAGEVAMDDVVGGVGERLVVGGDGRLAATEP